MRLKVRKRRHKEMTQSLSTSRRGLTLVAALLLAATQFRGIARQADMAELMAVGTAFFQGTSLAFAAGVKDEDVGSTSANPSQISYPDRIKAFFDNLNSTFHLSPEELSSIEWMPEYLQWHHEMRQQFPGYSIFEHPDAPRTAVSFVMPDNQYGLTDRMQDLGHLIRVCHADKRVLFLKWFSAPLDLEEFLEPNLFNWTLPEHPHTRDPSVLMNKTFGMTLSKRDNAWLNYKAKPSDLHKRPFINDHPPMGSYLSPFHIYWQAAFRPSFRTAALMEEAKASMGLSNLDGQSYDAIHMRVGHPAFLKTKKYNAAAIQLDHGGNKLAQYPDLCLRAAARAIQCSHLLAASAAQSNSSVDHHHENANNLTIFFYSDEVRLANIILHPQNFTPITTSPHLAAPKQQDSQRQAHQELLQALSTTQNANATSTSASVTTRLVARTNARIHHLGKQSQTTNTTDHESNVNPTMMSTEEQKDVAFEGFANTFVDLYIASQARCINLGVGRYGFLAAKIGGIKCWTEHMSVPPWLVNAWGMQQLTAEVPTCPYAF